MMKYSENWWTVSRLIRSKCFEICNPVSVAVFAWRSRFHFVFQGVVKQRMVKHGRDVAANWAKLESGKAACMQGCDFAAHGKTLF
jgi:hypothetical protein